ncbi:putative isomerase [Trifolium repens]|nr:putative isomerase [Trifolium repens]
MSKKPVKYYVVNAFTDTAFKGNPAAVCLLEEEQDEKWLQALAAEFNISVTCYVIPLQGTTSNPRFRLRWFTHILEVNICAHATLAASHALFSSGLVDNNVTIEFVTQSGILTAKKISMINGTSHLKNLQNGNKAKDVLHIELDFPADPITELNIDDTSLISQALDGASIVDLKRTQIQHDILVVVTSGQNVTEVEPKFDEIVKCPGRGIIVTGIAPPESGFDFYSRFFCPKYGVNEDPVCGSAHCALASYWSKKLEKCDLKAYQASARGGVLNIHINEQKQRVFLRGKAITVMKGCVLV